MPFVNVRTAKGLLNENQKSELQERITDLLVEIEGLGDPEFKKYIMVLIEEHEPNDWCISGNQITPEFVEQALEILAWCGGTEVARSLLAEQPKAP